MYYSADDVLNHANANKWNCVFNYEYVNNIADYIKLKNNIKLVIHVIEFTENGNNSVNKKILNDLKEEADFIEKRIKNDHNVSLDFIITKFGHATTNQVVDVIKDSNENNAINGIFILGDIPSRLNKDKIYSSIADNKDIMFSTNSLMSSVKAGEGGVFLRNIIPHDPKAAAVINLINHHIYTLDSKEDTDDYTDRLFGIEEERIFKKVVIYGDKNDIHVRYLSVMLAKRGVSNIKYADEEFKDDMKDASLLICMMNKPNSINEKDISKDCFVIDAGFGEWKENEHEDTLKKYPFHEYCIDKDICGDFKGFSKPDNPFSTKQSFIGLYPPFEVEELMIKNMIRNTMYSYAYDNYSPSSITNMDKKEEEYTTDEVLTYGVFS